MAKHVKRIASDIQVEKDRDLQSDSDEEVDKVTLYKKFQRLDSEKNLQMEKIDKKVH
jgi:hypothetical protein